MYIALKLELPGFGAEPQEILRGAASLQNKAIVITFAPHYPRSKNIGCKRVVYKGIARETPLVKDERRPNFLYAVIVRDMSICADSVYKISCISNFALVICVQ